MSLSQAFRAVVRDILNLSHEIVQREKDIERLDAASKLDKLMN
jgi:hypothetical protein